MTGPEDSQSTRPISVAELLARNGTIGAPPVGGRRRRRRGDTDSISVAELTGEIPIVSDHDIADHEVEEPKPPRAPSARRRRTRRARRADQPRDQQRRRRPSGRRDRGGRRVRGCRRHRPRHRCHRHQGATPRTSSRCRRRRPTTTTPTTTTPMRCPNTRPTSSSEKTTSTWPSSLHRGARATPRAASTPAWRAPRR